MGHVFMSYSRRDKELVDRIVRLMFRSSIHVWIDRENIKAGKTWRVQIVEAIDTCDVFILMISANSAASDNVRREIDLAHDSGRTIIPVMLEKIKIPADIRYQLAGLQFIDMQSLGFDVAMRQLIETVNAYRAKLNPQPTATRQMELVIQGVDLASFGESKKAELIAFIAKLTNTNQSNLTISGLAAGSVHVFVDMPADSAFKLKTLALNREKRFKQLGITSLRILGSSKFVNISLGILTTTATIGALHLLWLSLPSLLPSLFGVTVGKVVLVTTAVAATTAVTAVSVDMAAHPDHRYVAFNPIEIFSPAATETVFPTATAESLNITIPFTEAPAFAPDSILNSSESIKPTITVSPLPPTSGPSLYSISNVQLNNGEGNIADVNAGSSVSIALDYKIWNQPDCPSCIDQIVIGLDTTPLYCAYEGIPGPEPGESGSNSNTFTAPTTSGTHTLYAFFTQQYSCTDALALYSPGTAIGTINVSGLPVSYIRGDGDNSCPAGYTLATYSDASSDTDLICSVLDTWDIARLEGGGSFDGPGYGCGFRSSDERSLGNSVCKLGSPNLIPAPKPAQWNITNVKLNAGDSSATVDAGASVAVSLNYEVWNQSDCPACIDQIVIGLDTKSLYCAYEGIPGSEPGKSGLNDNKITVPNTAGTYTLYAYFAQQYTCADALANYSPAKAIGTITVSGSPNPTPTATPIIQPVIPGAPHNVISNVQLNSSGSSITVDAGSSVSVSLNYEVWNQADCPSCIDQIVIGLDSAPLYCAYEGIPGVQPGESGSNSNTITASTANGTYTLYAFFTQQYSCSDAMASYKPAKAIGTITVSAPVPSPAPSYTRGSGDNSCPAGYILASYSDASRDTDLICSILDTWDIARLEGGGSFDGAGYGCQFRDFDDRSLGNSVCKMP